MPKRTNHIVGYITITTGLIQDINLTIQRAELSWKEAWDIYHELKKHSESLQTIMEEIDTQYKVSNKVNPYSGR